MTSLGVEGEVGGGGGEVVELTFADDWKHKYFAGINFRS